MKRNYELRQHSVDDQPSDSGKPRLRFHRGHAYRCEKCGHGGPKKREAWLEEAIDDDWIAAYRLLPQDGLPVIAEVRLFPREGHRGRTAGTWSVERRELEARVPSGGITAAVLRKLGTHRVYAEAQKIFDNMASELGRRYFYGKSGTAGAIGFDARAAAEIRPVRRAPRGCDELNYARIARMYAEAVEDGQRAPLRAVAAESRYSEKYAGELVAKARTLGLLTRAPKRGSAGGRLTAKAKALLANADDAGRA